MTSVGIRFVKQEQCANLENPLTEYCYERCGELPM